MQDINKILFAVWNDCRAFFEDFFYNGVIAGAVLGFLYCIVLLGRFICARNNERNNIFRACWKIPFLALLGFYCYLVLGITLLSRGEETAYIVRLIPFSTWGTDVWSMTLWIENILMMVPLGILLYILWLPFRRLGWSMLAGFLCSLSIECIQLFTRLGKFETDDIMNNMLGMMIGFWGCKVIDRIFNRDKVKSRQL